MAAQSPSAINPNGLEFFPTNCKDDCSVWFYFLKEKKGFHGQCMDCEGIIGANQKSTSGMTRHLLLHDIDLVERRNAKLAKTKKTGQCLS